MADSQELSQPDPTVTPLEPYPEPRVTSVAAYPYPDIDVSYPLAYPYPGVEAEPYPGVMDDLVQPYPEPGFTETPINPVPTTTPTSAPLEATPTVTLLPGDLPMNTPSATPTPTHTPTNPPTATQDRGTYPGPEQTETPADPYPDPEQTITPSTPYPDPEQSATPSSTPTVTLSPTSQPGTPTLTPTLLVLPTLENPPTPVITLPYTETQIITDGSVYQAIWMDDVELALATSNGVVLYQQGEEEPRILDKGMSILSVARMSAGDWIAGGGGDSLIRIWERPTGNFLDHLSGHLLGVVRLSYTQVGSFLASASDDATVRIWSYDGSPLHTLRGPDTRVTDLAISPNGQMVAAASNQNVHIWNPQSAELAHALNQPEGWFTALDFNPYSQVLATAHDGRGLEFWDAVTWERMDRIAINAPVQSLVYNRDGSLLAVGFEDGRIQIWNIYSKYILVDLIGNPQLTDIAFSPYDDQLVSTSADGSIRLWDLTPLLIP
jgi:hypothetical protein